ncbi:class I SAM-dependent methyltransferase [Salinirubrum litoreum]|uniref:Class I SAM-dependent methyltransferase n=1 Tax=Salinirubrum litoreum TaxID=1126234 RepID=A0ABD5RC21_9EURY|nr:methyltransferase domain-containing protein [Salinirubrum litoreum]
MTDRAGESDPADRSAETVPDGVTATQQFYTRWAGLYDALATRTPGIGSLRARAADRLAPDRGDTVVEMGCGTGANLSHLRERVGPEGTVIGVDFTPGMVATATQRVRSEGWANVHVVRGDATRPPLSAGDADALLSSFVVGMLGDPASAVADWTDLVGEHGRVALLDLARSTRTVGAPLNAVFRAFVLASSPPGTSERHGGSPGGVLDRRVASAHRTLFDHCSDVEHSTHALGFVRLSSGTVE